MKKVRAKKHLGQHFLTQTEIANDIAHGISDKESVKNVLEIGPGMAIPFMFMKGTAGLGRPAPSWKISEN